MPVKAKPFYNDGGGILDKIANALKKAKNVLNPPKESVRPQSGPIFSNPKVNPTMSDKVDYSYANEIRKGLPIITDWSTMEKQALPMFKESQVPAQVGMGMLAGEGRLGGWGAERNNYFNLGAYDNQEENMPSYPTAKEGVQRFIDLITGNFIRKDTGEVDDRYKPAFELRDNPEAMLRKIHELGYSTRPDYADFIMSTPEWSKYR